MLFLVIFFLITIFVISKLIFVEVSIVTGLSLSLWAIVFGINDFTRSHVQINTIMTIYEGVKEIIATTFIINIMYVILIKSEMLSVNLSETTFIKIIEPTGVVLIIGILVFFGKRFRPRV